MKVRDVIRILEQHGWFKVAQEGSHRQYKHLLKKGRVTVAGALKDDLSPKTLKSIFKQAGLEI